jgi:hypothetical protein
MARASQIIDGKKLCGKCKQWLPVDHFFRLTRAVTGLASACKKCTRVVHQKGAYHVKYRDQNPEKVAAEKRRRHLLIMYGVTPEWYDATLASQEGVCAICGEAETVMRFGKLKMLAVDHDHTSREPRGLLCQGCNQGIGQLGEDPKRMEAAALYLEAHLS